MLHFIMHKQRNGGHAADVGRVSADVRHHRTMPDTDAHPSIRISPWNGSEEQLSAAADLYAEVFTEEPYGDDPVTSRTSFPVRVRSRASTKPDFRLLLAWHGDRIVGLVLGTGVVEGDWWRDSIVEQLAPTTRDEWFGDACFVIEELAVARTHRRSGVAQALGIAVLEDLPYPTAVLSCFAEAVSARSFYDAQGWDEIAEDVRVGASPRLCILARTLGAQPPRVN